MNKLIDLAKKFESKLGMKSEDGNKIPKQFQKIAKTEHKLQKKIAQHQSAVGKFSVDVTVTTTQGKIPGIYLVCNDCDGRGKTISSHSNLTIKFASMDQEIPATTITTCIACKGKRVIKVADIRKCSEEQLNERTQYVKDKESNKRTKKAEKKKNKAAKAIAKAEQKRIEAENPMAFKAMKMKKKADKKAKKAAKKAIKAVNKAQKAEQKSTEE